MAVNKILQLYLPACLIKPLQINKGEDDDLQGMESADQQRAEPYRG